MSLRGKSFVMLSISKYGYIFTQPDQSSRLKIKEYKEKKKHMADYTSNECFNIL